MNSPYKRKINDLHSQTKRLISREPLLIMSTRADYADQSADHADARGCWVNVHHDCVFWGGEVNMCLQVPICRPCGGVYMCLQVQICLPCGGVYMCLQVQICLPCGGGSTHVYKCRSTDHVGRGVYPCRTPHVTTPVGRIGTCRHLVTAYWCLHPPIPISGGRQW